MYAGCGDGTPEPEPCQRSDWAARVKAAKLERENEALRAENEVLLKAYKRLEEELAWLREDADLAPDRDDVGIPF